jgi:hypothetical protein
MEEVVVHIVQVGIHMEDLDIREVPMDHHMDQDIHKMEGQFTIQITIIEVDLNMVQVITHTLQVRQGTIQITITIMEVTTTITETQAVVFQGLGGSSF